MALTFKGIGAGGFGGYELTSILVMNLKFWIDWGLLHHGAFNHVRLDSASSLNEHESRLRLVPDERYEYGRVWNGIGREWVWESGVQFADPPFRCSGVYINGAFHPFDETGAHAHHVDYQNGRIVFDLPQDPEWDIRAEYCHRQVHVTSAESADLRILLARSMESFLLGTEPSGTPSREHQVWLPAIFIDTSRGAQRGLALGGGQVKSRTVVLQVIADRKEDRDLLKDWLDYQSRAAFFLADPNQATLPFDQYGSVASGVTNWPDMANAFPWKKLRIVDGRCDSLNSLNPALFRARVEWDLEVDFGGI